MNVLYVAMTRPESFLFVITSLPKNEKVTYGTLFRDFLIEKGYWNDSLCSFSFGELTFLSSKDKKEDENYFIPFQKG